MSIPSVMVPSGKLADPMFLRRKAKLRHLLTALHHIAEPDAVDRVGAEKLEGHIDFCATYFALQGDFTLETVPFWPVEEPIVFKLHT